MNNNDMFNDELKETIYHGKSNDDLEEIKQQLVLFSKELIERRRDIPYEEGLQAVMVIFEDKFGAKITENDGESTHIHSLINTVKFLNDDHNYVTRDGVSRYNLIKKEYSQLMEGINMRILDGENRIMFAITLDNDKTSPYQYQILKMFLDLWRSIKENNIYEIIEIGITLPEYKMEFCTDWDEKFKELEEIFENKHK